MGASASGPKAGIVGPSRDVAEGPIETVAWIFEAKLAPSTLFDVCLLN